MKKIIELLKKYINRETVSYLIFGVLTTVVDIIVYYVFGTTLALNYIIAKIIAWVVAVSFAFITNKLYVFGSKSFHPLLLRKEFITFVISRILSLLFAIAFIAATVEWLGIDKNIANLASNVFVVIINYVLSKLFVFNKEKN